MPGDPFYKSRPWYRIRQKALIRDRYLCVLCGVSVRGKGLMRVDHIKQRLAYPALALHLPNLRTLCVPCDQARHVHDRAGRDTPDIGPDGFPVEGEWSA